MALIYAALGDKEAALSWLDRSSRDGDVVSICERRSQAGHAAFRSTVPAVLMRLGLG
jgi:hypothetical protein